MKKTCVVMTACCLVLLSSEGVSQVGAKTSLAGVWRVVQIATMANQPVQDAPEPGLLIFTDRHYSMLFLLDKRPDASDQGPVNAELLRSLWGPVISHSGAYVVSDGARLTMQPIVAKNRWVTAKSVAFGASFVLKGDELVITESSGRRLYCKRIE